MCHADRHITEDDRMLKESETVSQYSLKCTHSCNQVVAVLGFFFLLCVFFCVFFPTQAVWTP